MIDPIELQAWCDAHPDYAEYKRKQKAHVQSLADLSGMTYDEYVDMINLSAKKLSQLT